MYNSFNFNHEGTITKPNKLVELIMFKSVKRQ